MWHPNERKLLTSHYVYDLDSDNLIPLPIVIGSQSYWSPNGKHIYIRTGQNVLLRTNADGQELMYLGNLHTNFIPISDSTFFSFTSAGIEIADTAGVKQTIELQWMREIMPRIWNISISPDGRFVLADFLENGNNRWNGKQFLGMLDLQTYMLKKVLPSQRLSNEYYPSMTSRGTILISYVCRSESIYGVWEIDTNGVFLRQIIGKNEFQHLTNVERPLPSPADFSIHSFFPHPGSDNGTVEYAIEKAGIYSLHLIDLSGKIIKAIREQAWHAPGRYRESVSTGSVPLGLYLIRLSDARNVAVYQKLVVEQ